MRWELNGKKKGGTESEEFHDAMRDEAGAVECKKCKIKIGQGNKGQSMNVCIGCINYFCNDHIERHDDCEEGR
jgi:hypothetical protein